MFSSISWQQYIVTVLVATVLYYLFIWVVFFKAKWAFLPGMTNFSLKPDDESGDVMTTSQHIIEEIKTVFANKKNKNELILGLQSKLRPYSNWEEPGFRETINQYIADQSESICSIHLSESDLRAVWP